ncbi:unnamed protein product [Cylicocyclus nassatus]|uniref:Uncharacterized protein n=1 Tax=Cylicocyclus nassatus TaxID=53992 RepID=A0AA36GQ69_CYLNA|nr:unnamed protein product [Cylicocyclus nassatus]
MNDYQKSNNSFWRRAEYFSLKIPNHRQGLTNRMVWSMLNGGPLSISYAAWPNSHHPISCVSLFDTLFLGIQAS